MRLPLAGHRGQSRQIESQGRNSGSPYRRDAPAGGSDHATVATMPANWSFGMACCAPNAKQSCFS